MSKIIKLFRWITCRSVVSTALFLALSVPCFAGMGGQMSPQVKTSGTIILNSSVTGTAVTAVALTGLDAATHGGYEFEIVIYNTTGSNAIYRLYYNNDLVNTDYYTYSVTGTGGNDAHFSLFGQVIVAGYSTVLKGTVTQTSDGHVSVWYSSTCWNASGINYFYGMTHHFKVTAVSGTNLSELDIVSDQSLGIGINSRFRIWRRM
jgi:hypothetical protein